jgi:hypothetical protein
MLIAFRVLAYIKFMPLPASMNTRPMSYPLIYAFNTIGACLGLGTFLGWSALLNLTGWSDHFKYSIAAGGDDIAKFTCLDMLFALFWTLGLAGSLQICTLLMLTILQDVALDILDLCLYLLDVLLDLTP